MSHSRLLGLIVALVMATIVAPAPVAAGEIEGAGFGSSLPEEPPPDVTLASRGWPSPNRNLPPRSPYQLRQHNPKPNQPSQQASLHQAGLVVQFGSVNFLTHCIEFPDDEITGTELLRRSGLRVIMEVSGGAGAAICKIEEDGCDYPDEPCFCQCRGGGQCLYWAYYLWSGDGWHGSGIGSGSRKLGDGDVDGWVWGSTDPPPIISWDDIRDTHRTSAGYPRTEEEGSSLTITAPFRGDENSNGTASSRARPVGGIWNDPIEMDREADLYVARICGLADGRYETEVTYNDPDGLNGTDSWIQESVVGTPVTYTLFIPIHSVPLDIELRGKVR